MSAETRPPLGVGVGARQEQGSTELRARSLSGGAHDLGDLGALVPVSQQEPLVGCCAPRPFRGGGGRGGVISSCGAVDVIAHVRQTRAVPPPWNGGLSAAVPRGRGRARTGARDVRPWRPLAPARAGRALTPSPSPPQAASVLDVRYASAS